MDVDHPEPASPSLQQQMTELQTTLLNAFSSMREEFVSTREEFSDAFLSMREELNGALSSTRVELNGALSSMREELNGALASTREELNGALASTREELNMALSSTREELNRAVLSTREELNRAVLSTREELNGALSSMLEELKKHRETNSRRADSIETLHYRLFAMSENSKLRRYNAAAISLDPDNELKPLVDVWTGTEISNFPKRLEDIEAMDVVSLTRILHALQASEQGGDIMKLREKLRCAII